MLYTPYRVMNASIVSFIDVFVVIDLSLRSLRLRLYCPWVIPSAGPAVAQGLSTALTIIGLGLIASIGGTVSCLFLAGACSVKLSCNSGCLHIHYPLPVTVLQVPSMLLGLKGYPHTVFLGP